MNPNSYDRDPLKIEQIEVAFKAGEAVTLDSDLAPEIYGALGEL